MSGEAREIVGILLAAGGSRRMGQPKALLPWRGAPLAVGHVAALQAVCGRVRVVLGGHGEAIDVVLPEAVERVWNLRWAETGMAESLALALEDLPERAQALVTPVDLPPAPREVLERLLEAGAPAVPTVDGQDGHPALIEVGRIRAGLRAERLDLLLRGARRVEVGWRGVAVNANTAAEWAAVVSANSLQIKSFDLE